MKYLVKGGIWKNSEDEILKAAVMKYGLNQWSRISSLLVRKSAKHCKQRWYEWLDPSIKKTEWTREEDEKLLHLAKIFPTQWRTIAPMVGRTPTQCVERYDKLLDEAQGKDANDPNDPRKLKPGEIDPNPESKPARPDPLHMDEDEKEMIAEARVRLANTKGKKAKRIARERLIQEARRLAQLQKKRELRAAGINTSKKRKLKGIDYNNEIPFERTAPDYVYQTDAKETPKPDIKLQTMSINEVEGRQRDEQERKFKEIDKKRVKKLMDNDMETIAEKLQKEKEKLFSSKTKLELPTPQLKDSDLELIGKMNQGQEGSNVQGYATRALVGNYSTRDTMGQTPARTPMAPNNALKEARNLVALNKTETPLIGGDNAPLNDYVDPTSLKPAEFKVPETPNALKKSLESSRVPQSVRSMRGGMTPSVAGTPMRDNFGINQEWDDTQSQFSMASNDSIRLKQQQLKIKEDLKNLSKPKYEYQIEVPELIDEEEKQQMILDAEDIERRKEEERIKQIQMKMRLRSLAIQRNLPRPIKVPNTLYDHIYQQDTLPDTRKQANQMIETEMLNLLQFDSQNFPFQGVKPVSYEVSLEHYEESELNKASRLVQKEIQEIKDELKHGNIDKQFIQSKWEDASNNISYSQAFQKVQDLRDINKPEEYSLLLEQTNSKRDLFFRESKKLEVLEKNVGIKTMGYKKLMQKHQTEIIQLQQTNDNLGIEERVYQELRTQEDRSVLPRLDELRDFLAKLSYKNDQLKEKYEELLQDKQELLADGGLFQ